MTQNNSITVDAIREALSRVIAPELHRDLISLNMVRDITISGSDVSFTIVLTTPACPLRDKMEQDSRNPLASIPGLGKVTINWTANVPQDLRIQQQIGRNFRTTIAVSSGKGGVGKTTVAVNLALGLAKVGARVGLLDADILGPNVPMMMGVQEMPPPRNRMMVPAQRYGVKFISMAFLTKPDQPLVWRGPMLHRDIRQLLTDVDWGELDYLVIDLPPGTGDAQLSLAQAIPLTGANIVTQPMKVAAADALRGLKMFERLEVPIIGVVENMSGDFFGSGGGKELSMVHSVPYLGSIPLDAQVRVGGDSGNPIIVEYPESQLENPLLSLSRSLRPG